ncbi:competence protein ComJ [Radiobacillus deserti]|uniref:Uncharacterized protein n=1 Tax=Radiobacillus deserti TaxID=2594883 RepID=A0A516KEY1_9BACI|nr:competence protein ComJ [Radiobacillus deserti]QDP39968.1 hypothetical protein FN924_07195 [Radiobacillus deserti]
MQNTVRVRDKKEVDTDAIRAITVPFYISNKGIEVGSIMETKVIAIEEGMYGYFLPWIGSLLILLSLRMIILWRKLSRQMKN